MKPVFETYLSVNDTVEHLACVLGVEVSDARDDEGPVRIIETTEDGITFSFFAYRDKPFWSHLLSSDPADEMATIRFLSKLGIADEMIDVAVENETSAPKDGIDIDYLRDRVSVERHASLH